MDFLTAFPYIGIILLVVINALLVNNQNVVLEEDHPEHNEHSDK